VGFLVIIIALIHKIMRDANKLADSRA